MLVEWTATPSCRSIPPSRRKGASNDDPGSYRTRCLDIRGSHGYFQASIRFLHVGGFLDGSRADDQGDVGMKPNPEYATVFSLKRRICSRLRHMVRPLLWRASGFSGDDGKGLRIFIFDIAGLQELYKIRRVISIPEDGIEGFTSDGIIEDGYGGGMVTGRFEQYALEDLIRLENFLVRMLPRFRDARKRMKQKDKEKTHGT
jgi:hypothetical protein